MVKIRMENEKGEVPMGRMILNVITFISIVVCLLAGCMADSLTLMPVLIGLVSAVVGGLSCLIREKLC